MHLTWEYPPLVYGGLGRHVHAVATAQVALGHDVTVITQQPDERPRIEQLEGVTVVRGAPTPGLDFVPDNLLQWVGELDLALAEAAAAQISRATPDVVHAHDWMTTQAGLSAAAAADAPLVATIHATERGRHQGYLSGEISTNVDATERFLCAQADALIACSHAMCAEIVDQLGAAASKVTVIPNGIDTRSWRTTDERRQYARSRWGSLGPLLVFTGRLEVEKGIYTMLEAMPEIRGRHPNARLVVVGHGGQEGYFDADVERHGLQDAVVRTGWLDESDLRALIAAADVALVPSLYEPFGMVALEAMALGTPVVAAATGGLLDIVDDGRTGLTFPPGDRDALAARVHQVLDDPASARERARIAESELRVRFHWRSIAAETVEVYRRSIGDHRPAATEG